MNSLVLVAFFAVFAAASASVIAPAAGILEGPSSRTTIVGPEGSIISSLAPGGKIITEELPAVAAYSTPGAILPVYTAPAVVSTYAAPYVAARADAWAPAPIATAYPTPFVAAHGRADTIIAGPSGTITASRSLTSADLVAPNWPLY